MRKEGVSLGEPIHATTPTSHVKESLANHKSEETPSQSLLAVIASTRTG